MKRPVALLWVGLFTFFVAWAPYKITASAPQPKIVISQFKVTPHDGQFITLYNPGSQTLNLNNFRLEYFNKADPSKASSSKLIGLNGDLPANSYYMINDGPLLLCYQMIVSSGSLSMSSSSGFLQLSHFDSGLSSALLPTLDDYVNWDKPSTKSYTRVDGAQLLPGNTAAFLQRQPLDKNHNPDISSYGAGSWLAVQPDTDAAKPCNLITYVTTGTSRPASPSGGLLVPTAPVPATIVKLSNSSSPDAKILPPADVGLIAPQITELLPNPAKPQTDANDEFVELYNPNPKNFDLSGFTLQVGTTTHHKYTFPADTSLPPKGFKAFFSSDTGLSLSNSVGQAELFDPYGNSIGRTEPYSSAKDGQAWAAAEGKWYWTSQPTPGAANVINQTGGSGSNSSSSSGKVKGASTSSANIQNTADSSSSSNQPTISALHPAVIALVAGAALLYGAYEYRHELANQLYRFRRYREARKSTGKSA